MNEVKERARLQRLERLQANARARVARLEAAAKELDAAIAAEVPTPSARLTTAREHFARGLATILTGKGE